MGVCLICLAWAAFWLRSLYGRVLSMFGMGSRVAAAAAAADAAAAAAGTRHAVGQ